MELCFGTQIYQLHYQEWENMSSQSKMGKRAMLDEYI